MGCWTGLLSVVYGCMSMRLRVEGPVMDVKLGSYGWHNRVGLVGISV